MSRQKLPIEMGISLLVSGYISEKSDCCVRQCFVKRKIKIENKFFSFFEFSDHLEFSNCLKQRCSIRHFL